MATKRARHSDLVVDNSKGGHHHEPKEQRDANNDCIASAHLKLMEEFFDFYRSKISNMKKLPHQLKGSVDVVKEVPVDSHTFKEKLGMYFGDCLPANVVNDLCGLVRDNLYGKCSYCALPTESIVLSVLQILLDAGFKTCGPVEKNGDVSAKDVKVEAFRMMQKSTAGNILSPKLIHTRRFGKENNPCMVNFPHIETQNQTDTTLPILNNIPLLDTPLVVNNNFCHTETIKSMSKMNRPEFSIPPKCRPTSNLFQIHDPLNAVIDVDELQDKDSISHENLCQNDKASSDINVPGPNFNARCSELGKISDEIYNQKNFPASKSKNLVGTRRLGNEASNMSKKSFVHFNNSVEQPAAITPINSPQCNAQSSTCFPVTDEERRYYDIMCGLAYSQWKCLPAIKFLKTSVTYSSLGESVEPGGLVDNFFIAGCCRKLFEEHHPRRSKKHYFYPHVGGSLLSYSSQYDINVVKNSFHGANSAHKLHLSNKLCFPVWEKNHWFVFIVDLANKLFVFLDSLYDQADSFQICVRDSLITSFKECWYEHADVKVNIDNFSVHYPPVPKQSNLKDCGIFAIKFMELWDNSLDMRRLFSQSDIPNIRIKLAIRLFFSPSNSVDKSLVTKMYDEGINPRLCN